MSTQMVMDDDGTMIVDDDPLPYESGEPDEADRCIHDIPWNTYCRSCDGGFSVDDDPFDGYLDEDPPDREVWEDR